MNESHDAPEPRPTKTLIAIRLIGRTVVVSVILSLVLGAWFASTMSHGDATHPHFNVAEVLFNGAFFTPLLAVATFADAAFTEGIWLYPALAAGVAVASLPRVRRLSWKIVLGGALFAVAASFVIGYFFAEPYTGSL